MRMMKNDRQISLQVSKRKKWYSWLWDTNSTDITFLLVDVKFEISKSTHNIYVCLLNDVDKDTGEATVSLRFFNDLSTSFVYKKDEIFAVDIMDIFVILTLLETTFQNRKIT